jgi:hypothetical protein
VFHEVMIVNASLTIALAAILACPLFASALAGRS